MGAWPWTHLPHPTFWVYVACLSEELYFLPTCLKPKSESFLPHIYHHLLLTSHFQIFLQVHLHFSILIASYPISAHHHPSPRLLQGSLCLSPFCKSAHSFPYRFILGAARELFWRCKGKHPVFLLKTFQQLAPFSRVKLVLVGNTLC